MQSIRFFSDRPRALVLSALLCLCGGLSGCLIGSSSHTENTGKYVSPNTLAQILPGKDKSYVVALIGEPTSKSPAEGGCEVWKWCYTEKKTSSGSVIFLVSTDQKMTTERTTFIEFQGDKVVKAWND